MKKKGGKKTNQSIGDGMGPWRWTLFFFGMQLPPFFATFPFPVSPAQSVGILVQEVGMVPHTLERRYTVNLPQSA